jgi:hypothetical protein
MKFPKVTEAVDVDSALNLNPNNACALLELIFPIDFISGGV